MIHAEQHPVDGLELQGIVVVIDHLHQCVAGGKRQILLGGLALLLLLIAGLGSSQRVVAVTHGEQQGRHAGDVVLFLHGFIGGQALQSIGHSIDLLIGQLKAADVAAVLHQVEIIHLLHPLGSGSQGLNNGLVRIVDQQHHVGQLDGRVAAHLGPGRNAIQHGALGGTDQCAGAGGEIVSVQVHHTDQAMTDLAVGLLALDVDQGIGQRLEHAVRQILLHGVIDILNVLVHVGCLQIGFRQDQAQGGGRVAHLLFHRLPVLRLRGELVAGDDCPLVHVLALGQQDIRRIKTQLVKLLVHGLLLLYMYMVVYRLFYIDNTKLTLLLQSLFQIYSGKLKIFLCIYDVAREMLYKAVVFSEWRSLSYEGS